MAGLDPAIQNPAEVIEVVLDGRLGGGHDVVSVLHPLPSMAGLDPAIQGHTEHADMWLWRRPSRDRVTPMEPKNVNRR
jgi:hypothetical protein